MESYHSQQDCDSIGWKYQDCEQVPLYVLELKHYNILNTGFAIDLQQPSFARNMVLAQRMKLPAWVVIYAIAGDPDVPFNNTQFYFIPLNKQAYYMRGWQSERSYMQWEYEIRGEKPNASKLEKANDVVVKAKTPSIIWQGEYFRTKYCSF